MSSSVSRFGTGLPAFLLAVTLAPFHAAVADTAATDTHKNHPATGRFRAEYFLAVGGFFPQVDSSFSLSPSTGGSGESIDAENVLGLDGTVTSAWLNFDWRFLPRHQLQAAWFELNRSGSTSASREFTVGDTTAMVGASVSSKLDMELWRLTYGYSIVHEEKFDLALLIGTHIVTAKGTVTASGSIAVNGVPMAGGTSTESSSTYTFPLPHVGAELSYEVSPKWSAHFNMLLFALEYSNFRGSLFQFDATVAYQATKHFGLGAGYTYFNLNLQSQAAQLAGGFDYEFYGPAVFAYTTF